MANNNLKNPIKAKPGEIKEQSRKLFTIYNWPKIDINSDEEVADRIKLYFEYSMENDLKPTIEGLALAIGVSRSTLWDWETGRRRADVNSSRADIIKKAKDYIAFLMSDGAMNGKINPVTWIFYAKNYFGMSDKQEIEVKAQQPLNEIPLDEIQERVKKIPKNLTVDADFTEE